VKRPFLAVFLRKWPSGEAGEGEKGPFWQFFSGNGPLVKRVMEKIILRYSTAIAHQKKGK
jgi:hypothetical protein